jgi:hypothetical protein
MFSAVDADEEKAPWSNRQGASRWRCRAVGGSVWKEHGSIRVTAAQADSSRVDVVPCSIVRTQTYTDGHGLEAPDRRALKRGT